MMLLEELVTRIILSRLFLNEWYVSGKPPKPCEKTREAVFIRAAVQVSATIALSTDKTSEYLTI